MIASAALVRCGSPPAESIHADGIACGDLAIPKARVDRVIFARIARRGGDGIDAYLTGTEWPMQGLEPGSYLFISWHDDDGPQSAVFPVAAAERERVIAEVRKIGYSFLNALQERDDFKRRITRARADEHARKYLDKPFRVAGFHLGAGTYEFTILENPAGLDLICIEDQAIFSARRWWLVPAHILPTDDRESKGVIVYEDAKAREPVVSEIRFPLRKALPVE